MFDEQQLRFQNETNKVVEEMNKPLKKMQGDAYRCAATCCDNENYSMKNLHECVEDCTYSWKKAQDYVGEELKRVQDRLHRCLMDCHDKVKDHVGPNPSQLEMNKYKEQMDVCSKQCINGYCDLLPSLEKRVIQVLSERKYE